MTISNRVVRAIAAFANLHPVAQQALSDWFDEEREDPERERKWAIPDSN